MVMEDLCNFLFVHIQNIIYLTVFKFRLILIWIYLNFRLIENNKLQNATFKISYLQAYKFHCLLHIRNMICLKKKLQVRPYEPTSIHGLITEVFLSPFSVYCYILLCFHYPEILLFGSLI